MTNQFRVSAWVRAVFTEKEATDAPERSLRLAEEAIELAQACGVDAATLHRLVDYVLSRPTGKAAQEIAGCMVTVYAAASALGVDADSELEAELVRIHRPEVIERCRRRQHEKRAALAERCSCGKPTVTSDGLCSDCVDQWAKRLAEDSVKAGDIETAPRDERYTEDE